MQAYTEALNYDGIAINRMLLVITRTALETQTRALRLRNKKVRCMSPCMSSPAACLTMKWRSYRGSQFARNRKRGHANEANDSKDDVKYDVVKLKRVLKHILLEPPSQDVGGKPMTGLGVDLKKSTV